MRHNQLLGRRTQRRSTDLKRVSREGAERSTWGRGKSDSEIAKDKRNQRGSSEKKYTNTGKKENDKMGLKALKPATVDYDQEK